MITPGLSLTSQNITVSYSFNLPTQTAARADASDDDVNLAASQADTKVTLSEQGRDKARMEQQDDDEVILEQDDYPRRSMKMMNGIPLYGGSLVTVISYADGSSKMYDALTGREVTAQYISSLSQYGSDVNNATFSWSDSQGIYNGMSAAEIYEQIQQLLHGGAETLRWQ